jgi:site-specific DNA-methyltransferase (cytosine-N4-specific)
VTSPPYWGLRDYGVPGQLGLEQTPDEYIERMVEVFREVKRVLRDDGTLWVNMGDSYAGAGGQSPQSGPLFKGRARQRDNICVSLRGQGEGLKPKDLCGIPWMLAFALRADGWYLRSDIIWAKPNPMPESVTDRPTKAHEYIFLLSKSERYFYDPDAIKEKVTGEAHARGNGVNPKAMPPVAGHAHGPGSHHPIEHAKSKKDEIRSNNGEKDSTKFGRGAGWRNRQNESFSAAVVGLVEYRNKRTVWEVPSQPFPEAHFATFPEELIKPCILAGCPAGGTVLDPFFGSGTTGLVARANGCNAIGLELSMAYIEIAQKRLAQKVFQF